MKRCRNSDACGPVLNVVCHRSAQTQIIERLAAKLPDELIDVAIESLRNLFDAVNERAVRMLIATRILEHADPQRQRRQLLTELIVHFASDAPPLVFLSEHQASEEFAARAFRLGALSRRQIEMGSDDSDDRPPRCPADRVAA